MVANLLSWVSNFFQNLFNVVLSFLTTLFSGLFNGLIAVLKALFKPLLIVVALVFYFIYKLGLLFVTLLKVLLMVGKLLYSLIVGLFKTLGGLVWTDTAPPDHGSWSGAIGEVFKALEPYQLDKVAYVITFVIWMLFVVAALRMLSSRGDA